MFTLNRQNTNQIAFFLGDSSYSMASMNADNQLLRHVSHTFTKKTIATMGDVLASDVAELHLTGQSCRLILAPNLYQLVLMDALNVPEAEMAKALKWNLKGLIEYPLDDIAMDAFLVPPHGVSNQQKKAFVAVTPLSKLREKLALFDAAYLSIAEVSIAALALKNLCTLIPDFNEGVSLVMSLDQDHCQLHVFYQNALYLVRALPVSATLLRDNPAHQEATLLEIQRSTDYCLSALKLPEPRRICFTPEFHQATHLIEYLQKEQTKPVYLMDLNHLLPLKTPLGAAEQERLFYSIGGALHEVEETSPSLDNLEERESHASTR